VVIYARFAQNSYNPNPIFSSGVIIVDSKLDTALFC